MRQGRGKLLIDGYRIEQYLQAHADFSWAGHALRDVVIDQTEDNMQTALSPIIMHNGHDRIMVRKTLNQKPCTDSKDSERDARMIALWCDTIDAAYEQAPRFKLRAGANADCGQLSPYARPRSLRGFTAHVVAGVGVDHRCSGRTRSTVSIRYSPCGSDNKLTD